MSRLTGATAQKLTWPSIYGGMLIAALGTSVLERDAALGWTLVAVGAVAAAFGIALVVARARRRAD